MDKIYNPAPIEGHWYDYWERHGLFAPDMTANAEPYAILLPPPNVTGSLHMGHAFQHTLMDALIRYHRMRGYKTLWQAGTDHAGIATQMVVERQLDKQGISRHDLGREAFLERVWQWKEQSGGHITRQMRRLGASCDWSRERFTMDAAASAAVTKVFVDLYARGLIYRGQRLVNWDPQLGTAVSDLEVLNEEEEGKLWHIRYPLSDGSGHLVVATTRPETLFGDAAVAIHPDDERYQSLLGKTIKLPLTEREIPIIADDYVDPEFGTGCVKITPAHDFNDYEVGQRHALPLINVLNADATMADNVPIDFVGMDRFAARRAAIAALQAADLIEKIEPHTLKVPRGDRTGAVIEPFLTDQWYVKAGPLAERALQAVADGDVAFVPENWTKTYNQWLENIQDWCISRQLWWGHRVPAWYDDQGNIYVGYDEDDARQRAGLTDDVALRQDDDVLDTWFSSALWPFSTQGWPQQTPELQAFMPSSVLVTGFDIIFFWVARMVMMSYEFLDRRPFEHVYITGLIRDERGQKMSKSKGNVLDPIDIIDGIELEPLVAKRTASMMQPQLAQAVASSTREQFPDGIKAYGADALRFTFAALASPTRDINFDLGRVEGYRNFCNKIWNAARFALMHLADQPIATARDDSAASRWIISRLHHALDEVARHFAQYRFDLAARALYVFFWDELCDWYLELIKPQLKHESSAPSVRRTLLDVLDASLRALHPIMPFITESIWQQLRPLLGDPPQSICIADYPQADHWPMDEVASADIAWLQGVLLALRQIRGEMNISPGKRLSLRYANASEDDRQRFARFAAELSFIGRRDEWSEVAEATAPESAAGLVGNLKLLVPIAGLIDVTAERDRLAKAIVKVAAEVTKSERKLGNAGFVDKAPEAVVKQERERLAEHLRERDNLQTALDRLPTQ